MSRDHLYGMIELLMIPILDTYTLEHYVHRKFFTNEKLHRIGIKDSQALFEKNGQQLQTS